MASGEGEESLELESNSHSNVSIPSVNPSHFYSIRGQHDGTGSDPSNYNEVYQVFSRQEHAFQYFDSFGQEDEGDKEIMFKKEKKKKNMKIFSLESLREGRRKFIVADMDTFVRKYTGAAVQNR